MAVRRLQFVVGFPPRPANSAVVSLAFGRYMLEPFFAPCAIPVPAVKLVSLLGYCKYWLLWDCWSPSLSALDQGHLWGVIFWDNCEIGASACLLGHPKLPNTRFCFGDQLEPYVGGVVPSIRVEILHVQLCKCHLVWGCKGQDFELLTWYTQPMKLSCLLQTSVYWHRDHCEGGCWDIPANSNLPSRQGNHLTGPMVLVALRSIIQLPLQTLYAGPHLRCFLTSLTLSVNTQPSPQSP